MGIDLVNPLAAMRIANFVLTVCLVCLLWTGGQSLAIRQQGDGQWQDPLPAVQDYTEAALSARQIESGPALDVPGSVPQPVVEELPPPPPPPVTRTLSNENAEEFLHMKVAEQLSTVRPPSAPSMATIGAEDKGQPAQAGTHTSPATQSTSQPASEAQPPAKPSQQSELAVSHDVPDDEGRAPPSPTIQRPVTQLQMTTPLLDDPNANAALKMVGRGPHGTGWSEEDLTLASLPKGHPVVVDGNVEGVQGGQYFRGSAAAQALRGASSHTPAPTLPNPAAVPPPPPSTYAEANIMASSEDSPNFQSDDQPLSFVSTAQKLGAQTKTSASAQQNALSQQTTQAKSTASTSVKSQSMKHEDDLEQQSRYVGDVPSHILSDDAKVFTETSTARTQSGAHVGVIRQSIRPIDICQCPIYQFAHDRKADYNGPASKEEYWGCLRDKCEMCQRIVVDFVKEDACSSFASRPANHNLHAQCLDMVHTIQVLGSEVFGVIEDYHNQYRTTFTAARDVCATLSCCNQDDFEGWEFTGYGRLA